MFVFFSLEYEVVRKTLIHSQLIRAVIFVLSARRAGSFTLLRIFSVSTEMSYDLVQFRMHFEY